MGRPGPDGPDDDMLVRAWSLRILDGLPLVEVAQKLGIGLSTAKRWISQGRDLVRELEYLDAQRQQLNRANVREDAAAVMDMVRLWMVEYRNEGGDPIKCAEVVIKAEERKAKALGEQALARLDVGAAQQLPEPSPQTRRAIEAYRGGAG